MAELILEERFQAAANEINLTCKKYDIILSVQMQDANKLKQETKPEVKVEEKPKTQGEKK